MYQIYLGREAIGCAEIEKQGLMYCIRCQCRLSGEVAYKVVVKCDGKKADLGLLVPENGAFRLTKRLPIKELGSGEPSFHAVPRKVKPDAMFVPISADEPFAYLSRLEKAFMIRAGDQIHIGFSHPHTE